MALKTDRSTLQTDISFFMNEVATRGGVVAHSGTGASGAAMEACRARDRLRHAWSRATNRRDQEASQNCADLRSLHGNWPGTYSTQQTYIDRLGLPIPHVPVWPWCGCQRSCCSFDSDVWFRTIVKEGAS